MILILCFLHSLINLAGLILLLAMALILSFVIPLLLNSFIDTSLTIPINSLRIFLLFSFSFKLFSNVIIWFCSVSISKFKLSLSSILLCNSIFKSFKLFSTFIELFIHSLKKSLTFGTLELKILYSSVSTCKHTFLGFINSFFLAIFHYFHFFLAPCFPIF